jgi:hypothetical protein
MRIVICSISIYSSKVLAESCVRNIATTLSDDSASTDAACPEHHCIVVYNVHKNCSILIPLRALTSIVL